MRRRLIEFLVYIHVNLPADHDHEHAEALRDAEAAMGAELYERGAIQRVWRLPGRRGAVSIWQAADATELHGLIESLPLFPWCDIDVVPLAMHYIEQNARQRRSR